jgi:multidrug resistance efflux pump
MHKPPKFLPVLVLIVLAGAAVWYLNSRTTAASAASLSASGAFEARQFNLSAEASGRVLEVLVEEGQAVHAGDVLVRLDASLIDAQIAQAQANLTAAQANARAAQSNLELLQAGPSEQQLAVAQTAVNQAQIAADAALEAYQDLPEGLEDTANGKAAQLRLDQADAALDGAQAQYDLTRAGARPEQIAAAQAQLEAAQAQVENARAAVLALETQKARYSLLAPQDGVVLERSIEPGELASPGAALLVIGRLDELTLTVYVPEDRYGQIKLNETYPVSVDSFPGETFPARVMHVSDQAEFTPRNVQTTDSRKNTVFAIRLLVAAPDGRLKPGMPADVDFSQGED